jgi:hypothetical protein
MQAEAVSPAFPIYHSNNSKKYVLKYENVPTFSTHLFQLLRHTIRAGLFYGRIRDDYSQTLWMLIRHTFCFMIMPIVIGLKGYKVIEKGILNQVSFTINLNKRPIPVRGALC